MEKRGNRELYRLLFFCIQIFSLLVHFISKERNPGCFFLGTSHGLCMWTAWGGSCWFEAACLSNSFTHVVWTVMLSCGPGGHNRNTQLLFCYCLNCCFCILNLKTVTSVCFSFIYRVHLPTQTKCVCPMGLLQEQAWGARECCFPAQRQAYCHCQGEGFKSPSLLGNSMLSPKTNLNYLNCFNQLNYQHNYIHNANMLTSSTACIPAEIDDCMLENNWHWWTSQSHMWLWHINQVFGRIRLLAGFTFQQ